MEEVWKPVPGYEGLYEVSNTGYVKGLGHWIKCNKYGKRWKTETILSPNNCRGYKRVILCKDGKKEYMFVHRIVAEAFIPNPESLPIVNHINEDKTDNRVENLEWCTTFYNNNYGTHNQRVIESNIKNGFWNPDHLGLEYSERMKKYYQEHKEKIKAYHRKYYQEHKTAYKS